MVRTFCCSGLFIIAPLLIRNLAGSLVAIGEFAIVFVFDGEEGLAILPLMVWSVAMIAACTPYEFTLGLEARGKGSSRSVAR